MLKQENRSDQQIEQANHPQNKALRSTGPALHKSLRITCIYLAVGCFWIIFSDTITATIFRELSSVAAVSMIKGIFYVVATSVLIFSLVYPSLSKAIAAQKSMQAANEQLEGAIQELTNEKEKLQASEQKLKENETLFRSVYDQAPIGIYIGHDSEYMESIFGKGPAVNPMFRSITGRTAQELSNGNWQEITHPDDLALDMQNFDKLKLGLILGYDMEKRYVRPDGSYVWVHMIVSRLYLDHWAEFSYLCIIEDITNRKAMGEALKDSERSKTVLMSNLPGMAYRGKYNPYWTVDFVSPGCQELTGYSPQYLISHSKGGFQDLILPKYRVGLANAREQSLKDKTRFQAEYEISTATGAIKWVLELGQGVYDENGRSLCVEGLILDNAERKQQEIKLKYVSQHDPLTGLYNRLHFEEVISHEHTVHDDACKALLLITLNKFGAVNITHGYVYGEALLKQAAEKLTAFSDQNRQLFHIANDRFILYIRGYKDKTELEQLCIKILEVLDTCLSSVRVRASIGVLEMDGAYSDPDSLLKLATIAASHAADSPSSRHSFFDRQMEAAIIRKELVKAELNRSAADEYDISLYLVYQPIFHVKTGEIYGFEALARFTGKSAGRVPPNEFIPIAEEAQLIVPLGKRIILLACNFLKRLENMGILDRMVSINISAIQLLTDDFLPDLLQTIALTGVHAQNITLEITESVFSDNFRKINERLSLIREKGIVISIDDFGTGYSSLARENELNVNCLKLDKQFIDGLLSQDTKEIIAGDIISMAHKLGHSVVAEGVEHEMQRQYLLDNNCDYIQGYLYSYPLPENEAVEMLKEQTLNRL